jgi:ankyrin repeat protein
LVEYLYEAWPGAVTVPTAKDGYLPLHVACCGEDKTLLSVVEFLVRATPESCQTKDKHGNTALHYACMRGSPAPVVQFLLKRDPTSARVRLPAGLLPLHLAFGAPQIQLEVVQSLVEAYPEGVKDKARSDGRLPVHMACTKNAPLAVVDFLVRHFPASVQQTMVDGLLPLHEALLKGSGEIARFLLEQSPGPIREPLKGLLPIHMTLLSKKAEVKNKSTIEFMIGLYPESIRALDGQGRTLLHSASFNQAPADVVDFLLEAWPEAVRVVDQEGGRLAIHAACRGGKSVAVLERMIQVWPACLEQPNSAGMLPLHECCSANPRLDFMQLLASKYPQALRTTDEKGFLPLHWSCRNRFTPPDVYLWLLKEYPESIRAKTVSGELPVHLVAVPTQCNAHRQRRVVQLLLRHWPEAMQQERPSVSRLASEFSW